MTAEDAKRNAAKNWDKFVKQITRTKFQLYVPELDTWIFSTYFSRKAEPIVGYSLKQWYDKYLCEIKDDSDIPTCSICGKQLTWWCVTRGYGDGDVCSHACRNAKYFADAEYKQRIGTKISNTQRAMYANNTELRVKASERAKRAMSNPAVRQKISQSTRIAMQRQEVKDTQLHGMLIANARPETHAHRSASAKAIMARPGVKERIRATRKITDAKPEVKRRRAEAQHRALLNGRDIMSLQPFMNCMRGYVQTAKYCLSAKASFRSNNERKFIHFCERNKLHYSIETARCKYVFNSATHVYIADFVVHFNNAQIVVEIKPAKWLHDDIVIAKAAAMTAYVNASTELSAYCIISDTDLCETDEHIIDILQASLL
jgi:hypothetical protein